MAGRRAGSLAPRSVVAASSRSGHTQGARGERSRRRRTTFGPLHLLRRNALPGSIKASRQISSARRFCLPLGATAPVSAMPKPTLIGSAARGHCGPVDDRAQNCERDAQNGASCGGKHRADLLPRHDGSDRSSPRALLVARAKVKRGRPRRDTIERWPICRVGRRKILRRSDPKAITSHA